MKRETIRRGGRVALIMALSAGLSACTTAMILMLNQVELTELTADGDQLYIMGELNSKSFAQVQTAISEHPEIDTLVFTAMPGSLDDETTFAMGRWLREEGLNTHLTARSVIASGAVDLYLSGVSRTMEQGAQLGVHSWGYGSKEATDFPKDDPAHELNKSYIVDLGVPEEFYWFTIHQAPADAIYWMNEDEVARFGLTTEPISDADRSDDIPFTDFEAKRHDILSD
ncbi:MAG: hypothetical protein AAF926_06300 [Pseudomonadota bacterium]